jgi:DNA-binding transcriptional LysR family regulator
MKDIDSTGIRKLDGNLLLVLQSLLRTRSVTRTAEGLALSQSAVSHALGRLRDILNDPLFTRLQHGLMPTRKALELEPRVDFVVAQLDSLLGSRRMFSPQAAKRIFRVSAPEFVAATIGGRVMQTLMMTAPGCALHLVHLGDEEACERVRSGDLDLAIGRFGNPVDRGLVRTVFYEDEFCVAARSSNRHLPARLTAPAYRRLVHVFAEADSEISRLDTVERMDDLRFMVVPRWLAALAVAAATDLVATCPRRLAQSQAATLGLRTFSLPFAAPPITVSMVTVRDERDPAVPWLRELVLSCIAPGTDRSRKRAEEKLAVRR